MNASLPDGYDEGMLYLPFKAAADLHGDLLAQMVGSVPEKKSLGRGQSGRRK